MLILHLLLWPALFGAIVAVPSSAAGVKKAAEVAKLRSELEKAFEESDGAALDGPVVAPEWTQRGGQPVPQPAAKVIVDAATLSSAAAVRQEIQQAVAQQGQAPEVVQLEAHLKEIDSGHEASSLVGSPRQEMLGEAANDTKEKLQEEPNVVEANSASQGIDLEQLQRLELSKRRTRDMLVLGRIEELLNVSLPAEVDRWLPLQANGSAYLVGQQAEALLVLTGDFNPLQIYTLTGRVTALLGLDRWNAKLHVQEALLLMATEEQLSWLRLEPEKGGLAAFWHWPLGGGGGTVTKMIGFSLEGRDFLALMANRTLSTYAYDVEAEEFWIAQRLQLPEEISDLAVLDAGREVLLVVGQLNEALVYVCSSRGEQLQLRQLLEAPQVTAITAFHMGGRSYLALGGIRPQILVYVQGQMVPRTILGQNFGFVEHFLPVPVRSYRDDLLLLVQHRVEFDPHSLLVVEVLVWTGETFEAGLPPPCGGTFGASCLLDQERDGGIAGAALLRQLDQPPLVLVPRKQAPSGLYRLETQLLARNSEWQDLQEIQHFMENWVQEQDDLILLAERLLNEAEKEDFFEEVSTPLVVREGGAIDELYVNEERWTGADSELVMLELLEQIRLLEEQLESSKRTKRQPDDLFNFHYEKLEVDAIEAEELHVEQLNEVPYYLQNSALELAMGTINAQQLEVLEAPEEKLDPVEASESHQTLQLAGDLEFSFINEVNWSHLIDELVWRHRPLKLDQLTVDGPVVFEDSLHLNSLNELSFPGDFLWSQGNETSVVQAPKEFSNSLSVNAIDTSGSINGVNPQDVITLSDAQDWPGMVTFSHLEVSEQLELNGTAQGRQFEEAPLNPTLLESRLIHADCHFDQILVRGPVSLSGKLDNDTFDSLLGDLVQRPTDSGQELLVTGAKRVDQLILPVDAHVTDNAINGIPLQDFVTKHLPQTLWNLTQLGGYVYFHQLQLAKGFTYDGVRLEELLAESLQLNGTAPLVSPLTRLRFVGPAPEFDRLQVNHSLSQVALASGYQLLHEPLHLSTASFQRLAAEQAQVSHNVTGGKGILNGQNLGQLLHAKPRTWSGEVHVQELILPQGVHTDYLQAIKADFLLDFLQQLDELPLLILQGRLQVERIAVSGSVNAAETINGRDMSELQRQVVWLDRPNELRTRWILREPPHIQENLHILGSFNERLLPELLDDIVFRSDGEEQVIEGTKSFLAPIHTAQLQLAALNGVPFERVANKVNPLSLTGNVQLRGRLFVEDLQLQGPLNGKREPLIQLQKQLSWDPDRQSFMQLGEVAVPAKQLDHLTVLGYLGNNRSGEPLQRTLDQLVFKRQQPRIQVQGNKIFTGRVRIKGGANISSVNGLNLDQLLQQLILIDSEEEVSVMTPVTYEAPIRMEHLQAERLVLDGELLNGCNVSQWLRDTIRVDRDFQGPNVTFAQGSLDGNSLTVEQLNQVNLSLVVTRHTEQHLLGNLTAEELFLDGQVLVEGSVNGRNLSAEYANTLMTNPTSKEQRVETPLFLSTLDVAGSLDIISPVSGLNLSDVATLTEDPLRLQSPLYFATLEAPFLQTDQALNGFDFKDWYERSLWARGRQQQEITGNWRVKKLRVKQAADDELRPRRQTAKESYRELCERLSRILVPYQVQKFRQTFALKQAQDQADVRRLFAVEAPGGVTFLLINERGCWTRIHRWNGTVFEPAGAFQSGPVDEVTALKVGNTSSIPDFAFMTSYEMQADEHEASWNCSGWKASLLGWQLTKERRDMEPMDVPLDRLRALHEELHRQRPLAVHPVYQEAIRYLKRPPIESQLGKEWQEQKQRQELEPVELARMRSRLLETLEFRLQAEVNITQLSIPESDLFDEHLVEDFLELLQQLRGLRQRLDIDTLPLPDTPARVLAARSAQLIWPVLQELRELSLANETGRQELLLEQALLDVLAMANDVSSSGEDERLHAVIERLRGLQQELHRLEEEQEAALGSASAKEEQFVPPPNIDWRPLQTLRLFVGPVNRPRLLYARLTLLTPAVGPPPTTPSTAPAAHIQVHHANGSIFQSLAAERGARHLTTLRVRDETLLAFVEGCCTIRVLIYRGVQGFVSFAHFAAPQGNGEEVLQLLGLRVPLKRAPGAIYYLAVAQARRITFYELVVVGLLEPWLKCA